MQIPNIPLHSFSYYKNHLSILPLLKECPINLECKVRQSIVLGSHEMFIAEIVAIHADRDVMDDKRRPIIDKLKPLVYCTVSREYRGGLNKVLAHYGTAEKE